MSQNNQASSSSTSNRGLNRTEDEDLQLSTSWLRISTDPITGSDQRLEAYWRRALQLRWNTIKIKVSAFSSSVSQIQSLNINGLSEADLMKKSQEHCEHKWQTLMDTEKERGRRLTAQQSGDSTASSSRTVGTKKAKQIVGDKRKRDELIENVRKKLFETMDQVKFMMNSSAMSIDISRVEDPRSKVYYLKKQKELLDAWEAEKKERPSGRNIRRIIAEDDEDDDEDKTGDEVEEVVEE
ncbi:hypothetical protein BDF21DRAFT_468970 [Thamnidium elegans]|uniref:No apical meristem-associated C-terminal domain-containing protein n=1 Tax=Thamnidium elegans TaxID=101142 RepID=A0A8H7SV71_9FUNG|nr:hypothetical protein INT48_004171 [Thamnidium elegans]KAI8049323.1 hypothetical protein BDF21DRAFT_468970 [Thamnidium elegans]